MNEVLPMEFGRYRLTERLATGGMAVLYRATLDGAHDFRKHLVIKRIQRDLAIDQDFVTMFIDEAKLMVRLQHPKIVQVFELGTLENELFIAMELVEGTDLLEILRMQRARNEPVAPHYATHIAHEVLDALDYAHTATNDDNSPLNLVHRDISPGNVLISRRGDVKLADFGIAHAVTNQARTMAGTLKGKYSYMAPEQVVSSDSVDGRADVFAVGIVLSEMLIGRRLFTAASDLDILLMVRDANLSRLDKYGQHLDPGLVAILRRALQRDRNARYQTASEFRDALEDWLFETHQRVGPRDLAALVDEVLASRASRGPLPTPHTGTLSGPSTLGRQHEAARAAELGRARFEQAANDDTGVVGDPVSAEESSGYEVVQIEQARSKSVDLELANVVAAISDLELAPVDTGTPITEPVPAGSPIMIRFRQPTHAPIASGSQPETSSAVEPAPRPDEQPPEADADGEPDGISDLSETSAIRLLYGLVAQNATGLLVASTTTSTETEKRIYFVEGVPQYIESNQSDDLFGEFLVARGKVSRGELAMAMAVLPHFGNKLGSTLVGLGLLSPKDALDALAEQLRAKLEPVCVWSTGCFRWYRGREIPRDWQPLHIDPCAVIGSAIRLLDDDGLFEWARIHAQNALAPVENPRVPPQRYQLGNRIQQIATLMEGNWTIAEIQGLCPTPKAFIDTLRVLYLMEQTDLATWIR